MAKITEITQNSSENEVRYVEGETSPHDLSEERNEDDLFHDPLRDIYSRMTYQATEATEATEAELDDEYLEHDETWLERIIALKEIVPESTRSTLSTCVRTTCSMLIKSVKCTGRWAWMASTSFLLVGLPLILEMEKEQVLFEFEAAQFQQQTAQQMLQGAKL
jgi:mitochondrial import receptor subunit TOM22